MSDFSTKNTKPTAAEYLAATEAELLDRLNRNPTNMDSEFPFIQSVIAIRTAESQRKTNEDLVKQTRYLVFATWAICVVTLIAVFVSLKCK